MGQHCEKLCAASRIFLSLRIFGFRRQSFQPLKDNLGRHYSESLITKANGELSSHPECFDYPFLLNREIGRWIVMTKFMIILRGPQGCGKSHLAHYIKDKFPTAHICSVDDHINSRYSYFDDCEMEEAYFSCESEAKLLAEQGISPLVIDNTNMRSYECRPYTKIARLFDYSVMIVTPKTPWRFDVTTLAEKNIHRASAEAIRAAISHFEPIIDPIYYGWCFAGSPSRNVDSIPFREVNEDLPHRVTEKSIKSFIDTFLAVLNLSYARKRLILTCGLDPDIDRDQLAAFWLSAVIPYFGCASEPNPGVNPGRPHCTAFFSKCGLAPEASDYKHRSAVGDALLGTIQALCVKGLFITKRTIGLRIQMSDPNQLALWGGLDNESVDGYAPVRSLPMGCRAHVTLALAPGVSAVETGFDALRIMDAELAQRPDVSKIDMNDGILREIFVPSSADLDLIFYYQYTLPKTVRLMYTAVY